MVMRGCQLFPLEHEGEGRIEGAPLSPQPPTGVISAAHMGSQVLRTTGGLSFLPPEVRVAVRLALASGI